MPYPENKAVVAAFFLFVMSLSMSFIVMGCRENRPKLLPAKINPQSSLTITGILSQIHIGVITNGPSPVAPSQLKTLFRSRAAGIKSQAIFEETTPGNPFPISMVKGSYVAGSGARIEITLSDYTALAGNPESLPQLSWTANHIERETDREFEHVGFFNGTYFIEKYDQATRMGQVKLLLGSRLLVEINGFEVPDYTARVAMKELDLQRFNRMVQAAQATPSGLSR